MPGEEGNTQGSSTGFPYEQVGPSTPRSQFKVMHSFIEVGGE